MKAQQVRLRGVQDRGVRLRASTVLRSAAGVAAALAVSACVAQPGGAGYGAGAAGAQPVTLALPTSAASGRKVALLLPLTGPLADAGQSMLKAAQLAYGPPDATTPLVPEDTGGTPDGAAAAARAGLAAGAGLFLGPLTGSDTAAAAPIARAAGVPVLAFTSDSTQAQPGVWTLGVTPAQQVRRLVLAVQAEGKTRIAAVVLQNPFGAALAAGLREACAAAGLPPPAISEAPPSFSGLNATLKQVSDYAGRRGAIEARQRAARASRDAAGRAEARDLGQQQPSPPPFDALFLGVTGDLLAQSVPLLRFYDIGPDQVRILGPATWTRDAAHLPNLAGAWYAAPDPAQRAGFEQQYQSRYGAPPGSLTSLAFDGAAIARASATPGGYPVQALTRPEGFAGVDGLIALLPDGHVRRGLAIFEVDRGGAHIVQPSPTTLAAPGS